ncbi:hypothetical protein [Pseudotabrizicola algicola]|uniref:Transcriptional regulator n=1 Tax=Pseudotabrizicola algicola TaxID=2709381 RepID=A0A6B3RQ58_9RHOB|nr:hypothetical protein [Pseudotabrizicola algicola]NEX47631.1 hypothetical protein [Pseudotabrizicola algicola]
MSGPLDTARAAWGDGLPDWVEGLAIECGKASQAKVAKALGRSASLVSAVLANKYGGDLVAVEERYRGVYGRAVVACPALGNMPTNECQDWRAKAKRFQTGNPLRSRMFRACQRCPRYLKETQE